MNNITIEEAQKALPELLGRLQPGEEVVIVDRGQPLAQLRKAERASWPCQAGSYKKADFWIAADFNAPLSDFQEYME